ncbi:unnamed protein product [Periconia digitata]|uniref:1,3-beta-glucanosyltransferase n=1 Tax=Periconia digitata TaxID=1303443 RepID=A0A9W4XKA5_9PLEO|nr:unnamed protein product [Periconia digitata]
MASLKILLVGCFLAFAKLSATLDRVVTNGRFLVNNVTGGQIILNGVAYSTTNFTGSDKAKRDSLQNAEACRRDAALMQLLGINLIVVDGELDLNIDHDECFSIFNAVQIYILLNIQYDFVWNPLKDPGSSYAGDRPREIFQMIDAVKNYDNFLGLMVGMYPEPEYFPPFGNDIDQYVDAAKILRVFVRDVKEYAIKNSARPVIVGAMLNRAVDQDFWPDVLMWLSCNVVSESAPSAIDFLYLATGTTQFLNTTYSVNRIVKLGHFLNQTDYETPTLARYKTYKTNTNITSVYYNDNQTITHDNDIFFGGNGLFRYPLDDPFMGLIRDQWANVLINADYEPANLITIDVDDNVQLTWRFDTVNNILRNTNTEALIDESRPREQYIQPRLSCASDLIKNKTTTISGATYSLPADWELPTRPPQVDDLITKGASGKVGKMVDVTVTTIKQQIRDSNGKITNVLLRPTPSKARTTDPSTPPSIPSTSSLSTASKAGIGAGSAIGALVIIGMALFVYWRRNRQITSASSTEANAKAATEENLFFKPELPLNNVVEKGGDTPAELSQSLLQQQPPQELPGIQLGTDEVEECVPVVELPGKDTRGPQELAGDGATDLNNVKREPDERKIMSEKLTCRRLVQMEENKEMNKEHE